MTRRQIILDELRVTGVGGQEERELIASNIENRLAADRHDWPPAIARDVGRIADALEYANALRGLELAHTQNLDVAQATRAYNELRRMIGEGGHGGTVPR